MKAKWFAIKFFKNYFKDVKAGVHYNVRDRLEKRKVKIVIPKDLELGWHVIKAEKFRFVFIQK
jgi:hypothetical protein